MATTEERGDSVGVEVTQPVPVLDGDDITVVPEPHEGGSRRRVVWAIVAAAAVVLLVAGVAIALAGGDDEPTVQTAAPGILPSEAPAASTPEAAAPEPSAAQLPVVDNEAPPATNSEPANDDTESPVSSPAVVSPPPVTEAPKQPVVSGPQVLQWTVTPGTDITIPAGGSVTLRVTVDNPTGNPATLPSPLSCVGDVCPQSTQTIGAGVSASEQFTLQAADYTTTPKTVLLGGYYKITVKVAS